MPYHKAKDSKLDLFHNLDKGNIKIEWLFHTKHCIREGSMYTVCIIMASDASQKKNDNKVNTTVGPPLLPIKPLHKTPPLTNLRGGGVSGTPVPLWIRACFTWNVWYITSYVRMLLNVVDDVELSRRCCRGARNDGARWAEFPCCSVVEYDMIRVGCNK